MQVSAFWNLLSRAYLGSGRTRSCFHVRGEKPAGEQAYTAPHGDEPQRNSAWGLSRIGPLPCQHPDVFEGTPDTDQVRRKGEVNRISENGQADDKQYKGDAEEHG